MNKSWAAVPFFIFKYSKNVQFPTELQKIIQTSALYFKKREIM